MSKEIFDNVFLCCLIMFMLWFCPYKIVICCMVAIKMYWDYMHKQKIYILNEAAELDHVFAHRLFDCWLIDTQEDGIKSITPDQLLYILKHVRNSSKEKEGQVDVAWFWVRGEWREFVLNLNNLAKSAYENHDLMDYQNDPRLCKARNAFGSMLRFLSYGYKPRERYMSKCDPVVIHRQRILKKCIGGDAQWVNLRHLQKVFWPRGNKLYPTLLSVEMLEYNEEERETNNKNNREKEKDC